MEIFDITVTFSSDMPVFPGDPPVRVDSLTSIKHGDGANVASIACCTHSGTHIDAPRHYDDRGTSIDNLSLSALMGEAVVADLRGLTQIDSTALRSIHWGNTDRLLLKTDNSELWKKDGFHEGYAALTEDGAKFLVRQGVRLLGIDYLSVEPVDGNGAVHRALLEAGVILLEGIDLWAVESGIYELICLPLKIHAGDGAPARAILRRRSHQHKDFEPHTTKWPLA